MSRLDEMLKRVIENMMKKKVQEKAEKKEQCNRGFEPDIVIDDMISEKPKEEKCVEVPVVGCMGHKPYRKLGCDKCPDVNECIKKKVEHDFNEYFRWYVRIGGYRWGTR